MDYQIGAPTGINLVGLLVPGVLEKVGDNIFEVFFVLIRTDAIKHTRQLVFE